MYSNDGDKIRAFPFRPAAESSGLTDYIELSGCNGLLIEAVKKLYEVPNKPENPVEWLRLYFKYLAEDVAADVDTPAGVGLIGAGSRNSDSDFTRDPQEVEQLLKAELTEIEAEIISCFEEEAQNKAVIEKLENELKHVTLNSAKTHCYDDFLKYLDHGDDYHYRIRPDPLYQPSKTDMLLEDTDRDHRAGLGVHGKGLGGGFGGGAPLRQEDSMVELVPFNPHLWTGDGPYRPGGHPPLNRDEENIIYKDYPQLYFPDRQKKGVAEEAENVEEEDEETEEEMEEEGDEEEPDELFSRSEAGVGGGKHLGAEKKGRLRSRSGGLGEGSEYDGGSEGGDSEGETRVRTKTHSPYTPRSAHDKKHKERQATKSHHKATSDKNV